MASPADIKTLGDLTRMHAAERPDQIAMTCGESTITYGELDNQASQAAQALIAAGVGPQEQVAFLDKNSPEYFPYLFGAGKTNAICVAINWRLAPPEMEYILNNSEAKVLVIGEEFLDHLAKMSLDHVTTTVVVPTDPNASEVAGDHPSFAEWIGAHEPTDPLVPSDADDVCYQLYTSGTTGLPKGAQLTNSNFFEMLPLASSEWNFDEQSVNLVAMPLFHIAGSGWGVVGLYNGGHSVLLRDILPAEILDVIPRHGVTNTLFVPIVLQMLCGIPGVQDVDFSSLRTIVYGASPISEAVLVQSMETFGADLIQAYGLTETTGGVTILRAADHDPGGPRAHLLRSAGCPIDGVELKIVDPESLDTLPDGEVGEIWVRTNQNMKGYWKMPEETAKSLPGDGWFRTGDAGTLEEGFLYIKDRVKDMIISGGENIYPAEIENALMSHPGIADAAVIGVPDDKWGETVKAIVTRSDDDLTEDSIISFCRENLAHYKCPTSIDWHDAIPRNPSGKILKTELREPFWAGHDRRVSG